MPRSGRALRRVLVALVAMLGLMAACAVARPIHAAPPAPEVAAWSVPRAALCRPSVAERARPRPQRAPPVVAGFRLEPSPAPLAASFWRPRAPLYLTSKALLC